MNGYKAYIAEAIGTFALVFIGAGAVLAGNDVLGVALAHGLVLMSMVYATAHISGGHINPAVTIGMWITRKIKSVDAISYIIAQLIGAAIAGFLLQAVFSGAPAALNLGAPALGEGVGFLRGVVVEAVLTFFLVFVIFGIAVDKRGPPGPYGFAIGFVLAFDILVGFGLTGAAMNPARAFGPAFAADFWNNQLVYWIGPVIGGIVAALIYNYILLEKKRKK